MYLAHQNGIDTGRRDCNGPRNDLERYHVALVIKKKEIYILPGYQFLVVRMAVCLIEEERRSAVIPVSSITSLHCALLNICMFRTFLH